jgi:basic membrane protein A
MLRNHVTRGIAFIALALIPWALASAADIRPVALIIAQGGLGDQSYNDLADRGFKAALEETKLKGKEVESKDVVAQGDNMLRRASDGGFGLIIDLEYSHGDAMETVAKDYPNVDYAILNRVVPGSNVAGVLFKEHEGSYLAGALAAMVASDTKIKGVTDKPVIGVIGGIKAIGIDKFIAGYIQGAHDINPKVEVKVAYANSFGDPAIGHQIAKSMFDQGASIVYQVAGGTGIGVIQAAKESGRYAIGVDTDQDGMAPGNVLTSMIKRTDLGVAATIKQYKDGKFPGGKAVTLGLAEDGVGLSEMKYTKSLIPADYLSKVEDLKKKIVSGEIKVWDTTTQGMPDWFK